MPLYGSLAEGFCNCNWVLMYSMGHTARHSIPPAIQPAVIETHGFEDFFTPSSDIFTQRQEEAKGWYFLLCLLCKVQTHRASVAGSCSSLNRSIKQSIPNRCLVHLFFAVVSRMCHRHRAFTVQVQKCKEGVPCVATCRLAVSPCFRRFKFTTSAHSSELAGGWILRGFGVPVWFSVLWFSRI